MSLRRKGKVDVLSERSRTVIIFVITAVWAVNFTAGLVVPGYQTSESINGIFMAIVGGLFALSAKKDKDKDSDPPDDPPKEG